MNWEHLRPEDVSMQTTIDEIEVFDWSDVKAHIDAIRSNPGINVKVHCDFAHMTGDTPETLERITDMIVRMTEGFTTRLWRAIKQDFIDKQSPGLKMQDFIADRRHDLPRFVIADAEHAAAILGRIGFDEEITPDSFLLLFDLPKPL